MKAWRIDAPLLLVVGALVVSAASVAQDPGVLVAAAGIVEEDIGEDLETLLAEAEAVFGSADQPDSIPLFERIILLLERQRDEGTFDEQGAEWLCLSLFRRAEARHNLLDEEGATADLTALLRFDPGWEIPEGHEVSRKLSQLFTGVRDAETGLLDSLIEPADAEIYLDDVLLGTASGLRRVGAGERDLRVQRPGYTEHRQPLTIPPGASVPIELTLERTSAVVRLATQPSAVEVVLGDEVLAMSQPQDGLGEDQISADLVLEGLQPGERLLTLRKPGYRSVELQLTITELADYSAALATLERTRGTVAISKVPVAATVLVNGETQAAPGPSGLRLELPPGTHQLRVEAGTAGLFEQRFDLADRQVVEIEVRLRPALVLLGVLGGDRVAATALEEALVAGLGGLAGWTLIGPSERAFEVLRDAGVEPELLRGLAAGAGGDGPPDWTVLQGALDGELGGSAYLLAVLSDDLYASQADLWLWSAAPGPTRPVRRRVALGDGGAIDDLAEVLDQPLRLRAPWLGVRCLDSAGAGSPLVLSLAAEGPAMAAGLETGDEIVSVDGRAVASCGELAATAAGLEVGVEVELAVGGESAARSLRLTPGISPVMVSLSDPSGLDPALAARLASLEAGASGEVPAWLLRLNRAVVLMRGGDWRRAAEALRGIEAPVGGGIGQATVDYLLGVTLLEVDRTAYRETAEKLIGNAAQGDGAIEHHDGPRLAPLARARLETLLGES